MTVGEQMDNTNLSFHGWPREMRASTAAAYCDEVSVAEFLDQVAQNVFPKPRMTASGEHKWDRLVLDRSIAALHGQEAPPPATDVVDLI